MTVEISYLPEQEWRGCNKCDEDSVYQIENMFHGAIVYSCMDHLAETIKFELELN